MHRRQRSRGRRCVSGAPSRSDSTSSSSATARQMVGVGGAAVALDRGGEGPEMVGQRLFDGMGQKLAGSSGLTAPKKNHSRTSVPSGADAVDHPALAPEAPGREKMPVTASAVTNPQNSASASETSELPARLWLLGSACSSCARAGPSWGTAGNGPAWPGRRGGWRR